MPPIIITGPVVYKDRVWETTNSPGVGDIILQGHIAGPWQAFNAVGNNSLTHYLLIDQLGSRWEVGIAIFRINLSVRSLLRTAPTVIDGSSGAGVLVNFNSGVQNVIGVHPSAPFGSFGKGSFAEGFENVTYGQSSHAEGAGNLITSDAPAAHAEGGSNTVGAPVSHAEGYNNVISSGYGGHAEGGYNSVTAICGHAEGSGNIVSGVSAHGEGSYTHAEGIAAHTEGYASYASNDDAHAEGRKTAALGYAAHAEGYYTVAFAKQSHAEGYHTTAAKPYSHAGGFAAVAHLKAQWARAGGFFQTFGDAQYSNVSVMGRTVDATPVELTTDGHAVSFVTNVILVPNDTTFGVRISVTGRADGGTDVADYEYKCVIQDTGGTSTLVGTVQAVGTPIGSNGGAPPTGWDVSITASGLNSKLVITVTGAIGVNVNWLARVSLIELTN